MARWEFELAYFKIAVQHLRHYATGTPPEERKNERNKEITKRMKYIYIYIYIYIYREREREREREGRGDCGVTVKVVRSGIWDLMLKPERGCLQFA